MRSVALLVISVDPFGSRRLVEDPACYRYAVLWAKSTDILAVEKPEQSACLVSTRRTEWIAILNVCAVLLSQRVSSLV
jgi:hypothetical protein